MAKKTYTREFKLKVVRAVESGELRPVQACRESHFNATICPRVGLVIPILYVTICLTLAARVAASALAADRSPGEDSSFHSARPTATDRALRAMILGQTDH
jgi:hypothetical protein